MNRAGYIDFGSWIRNRLGCCVQKIAIDAGFTCPNRDGTLATGGCTFCNNRAFNPPYCNPVKRVQEQIEAGKRFFASKHKTAKYLANVRLKGIRSLFFAPRKSKYFYQIIGIYEKANMPTYI